jgi:hypothetical protein
MSDYCKTSLLAMHPFYMASFKKECIENVAWAGLIFILKVLYKLLCPAEGPLLFLNFVKNLGSGPDSSIV